MAQELFEIAEGESTRFVKRYGNVSTMMCRVCKCQLYRSDAKKPEGQFDLIEAKYCPMCGRKFKCDEYATRL